MNTDRRTHDSRHLLPLAVALVFAACAPDSAVPDGQVEVPDPRVESSEFAEGSEDGTTTADAIAGETVILLHGLGRTPASMALLGRRLSDAGFQVVNLEYPSTRASLDALVERLDSSVVACCGGAGARTHFVTHSMGGILVRAYLGGLDVPFEGRVVMLSPPNQGSEIIDAFGDSPLLQAALGPAGSRLGTDSASIPRALGPAGFSLGVIAGSRGGTFLGSRLIPGPDDGTVGVSQTWVEGTDDFLVVPATHTFIMNRRDVAEAIIHFLRRGRFPPPPSD
jgi:pimeloyl-ACP methyl ester carboxylesterase